MKTYNFVSQNKINELIESVNNNHITILQGPCGSSKSFTLNSLFPVHYIENIYLFKSFIGKRIAHTDIDNKDDIFKFIKKIFTNEIKIYKIVIETRTNISKIELNELIYKFTKIDDFDFSSSENYLESKMELTCKLVNFNKITDNKLKKYSSKFELIKGNLHKFHLQEYLLQKDESLSFYHFLGKIFYSEDKNKLNEIRNANFDKIKTINYLRENCIYFLEGKNLFDFIELISENENNHLVLIFYLFEIKKVKPGNFYGFKSLNKGERRSRFAYF